MKIKQQDPQGVGLGLRLSLAEELLKADNTRAGFVEIAPENYLGTGGRRARLLDMARERLPVISHGLTGDLAGTLPLDRAFWKNIRELLHSLGASWYSDHLSLTHVPGGAIHDLVPMPFNEEMLERTSRRVREVSDLIELPVAVENVSAYARMPGSTMEEAEFVRAVVERADCRLLLDVNNIYVNAHNFGLDARAYIDTLPLERVIEIHVAGHERESDDLLLDTHGAPVIDPVYDLLGYALERMTHRPPVLLERDNNIPPLAELEIELARIQTIVEQTDAKGKARKLVA